MVLPSHKSSEAVLSLSAHPYYTVMLACLAQTQVNLSYHNNIFQALASMPRAPAQSLLQR